MVRVNCLHLTKPSHSLSVPFHGLPREACPASSLVELSDEFVAVALGKTVLVSRKGVRGVKTIRESSSFTCLTWAHLADDKYVLFAGCQDGFVHAIGTDGTRLHSQKLHFSSVSGLRTHKTNLAFRGETTSLLVQYGSVLVYVFGESLQMDSARGGAWECRKWSLEGFRDVCQVVPCDRLVPLQDPLATAPSGSLWLLAAGSEPMLGVCSVADVHASVSAVHLARAVTSKLFQSGFSFVRDRLFGGGEAAGESVKSSSLSPSGGEAGSVVRWSDGRANPEATEEARQLAVSEPVGLATESYLRDERRSVVSLSLSPCGALAACTDSFGRAVLVDVHALIAVRMWKGRRGAQCAWMQPVRDDRPLGLFLAIYLPSRGLLELWRCERGPRVGARNVGVGCALKQLQTTSAPARACLVKPDGSVCMLALSEDYEHDLFRTYFNPRAAPRHIDIKHELTRRLAQWRTQPAHQCGGEYVRWWEVVACKWEAVRRAENESMADSPAGVSSTQTVEVDEKTGVSETFAIADKVDNKSISTGRELVFDGNQNVPLSDTQVMSASDGNVSSLTQKTTEIVSDVANLATPMVVDIPDLNLSKVSKLQQSEKEMRASSTTSFSPSQLDENIPKRLKIVIPPGSNTSIKRSSEPSITQISQPPPINCSAAAPVEAIASVFAKAHAPVEIGRALRVLFEAGSGAGVCYGLALSCLETAEDTVKSIGGADVESESVLQLIERYRTLVTVFIGSMYYHERIQQTSQCRIGESLCFCETLPLSLVEFVNVFDLDGQELSLLLSQSVSSLPTVILLQDKTQRVARILFAPLLCVGRTANKKSKTSRESKPPENMDEKEELTSDGDRASIIAGDLFILVSMVELQLEQEVTLLLSWLTTLLPDDLRGSTSELRAIEFDCVDAGARASELGRAIRLEDFAPFLQRPLSDLEGVLERGILALMSSRVSTGSCLAHCARFCRQVPRPTHALSVARVVMSVLISRAVTLNRGGKPLSTGLMREEGISSWVTIQWRAFYACVVEMFTASHQKATNTELISVHSIETTHPLPRMAALFLLDVCKNPDDFSKTLREVWGSERMATISEPPSSDEDYTPAQRVDIFRAQFPTQLAERAHVLAYALSELQERTKSESEEVAIKALEFAASIICHEMDDPIASAAAIELWNSAVAPVLAPLAANSFSGENRTERKESQKSNSTQSSENAPKPSLQLISPSSMKGSTESAGRDVSIQSPRDLTPR
eukprot:985584_1